MAQADVVRRRRRGGDVGWPGVVASLTRRSANVGAVELHPGCDGITARYLPDRVICIPAALIDFNLPAERLECRPPEN